jgi:hypothetical protein
MGILEELGFHRLGEAELQLPFRPAAITWVWVDAQDTIQAELAFGRVSFSSFFSDNALLVTDYPNGEHINQPAYQSHTITTSLPDAYRYHQRQVEKFSRLHGLPRLVQSMIGYLYWETMGRTFPYGRRKLRRFLRIELVRMGAFVYGLVVLGFSTASWFYPPLLPSGWNVSQGLMEVFSFLLTLPALFIPNLYAQWSIKQTYQDSAAKT